MSTNELQQQTTINVQEKANLIWAIADKLVGVYKPHEYGNVILPMCVVKRFEDTLAPTKQKVLDMNKQLDEEGMEVVFTEVLPPEEIGLAVMNRLGRAASFNIIRV